MNTCPHCHELLPDGQVECEDARACSKRVAKRLAPKIRDMVTKPFIGNFNPDEEYKRHMQRHREEKA